MGGKENLTLIERIQEGSEVAQFYLEKKLFRSDKY